MMLSFGARVLPAGDSAVLLEFADVISPAINRQVHAAGRSIVNAKIPGILSVIPAFSTILVQYEPGTVSLVALVDRLDNLLVDERPSQGGLTIEVPVWYGGEAGPDLVEVSKALKLSPHHVVEAHTAGPFYIYCLGFSPGFPLAGLLPSQLVLPRRQVPRTLVPAGTVAIAGSQTGIYPVPSPGGWHLIGRTPLMLFDWAKVPPCPYAPGDQLLFREISEEEYRHRTNAFRTSE